tara:strand:- start:302 stop:1810 length:1509 start_codon:yes stop_codon:yes gene_type:complete
METTIFGPPGTGKTTRLISIVQEEIANGTPPDKIAFVSFSRKAAEEARTRAAEKLGMSAEQMVWFRTLHSLAFQWLGISTKDVLYGNDFNQLGKLLGLEFTANSSVNMSDGTLFTAGKGGDAYLGLINMSRVRGVSLEQQFSDTNDRKLNFQQAKLVEKALNDYKKAMKKRDFVDMIQDFITQDQGPNLDVLIVDEAQDLVPMQWEMVKKVLVPRSKKVFYAGDDDQCIYSWMGVDVKEFLNASSNKIILDQSYRIPLHVHGIVENLVGRLSTRQPKVWKPTTKKGLVVWHYDMMDVDLRTGEWLILGRTNYIANKMANKLKESGYLFWKEGSGWSISPNVLNGIEVWNKICKNHQLSISEWKSFSKITQPHVFTKHGKQVLTSLDPEKLYSIDHMGDCLNVSAETHWNQVVKVSDKELTYINSVRKSGEKIWNGSPRIKISTIHKAKGGEADNVLLMLDSSRACAESPDQDSEIRTFYVGATRAKQELHIVESKTENGFKL